MGAGSGEGKENIIARGNVPVARLIAIKPVNGHKPGTMKGLNSNLELSIRLVRLN